MLPWNETEHQNLWGRGRFSDTFRCECGSAVCRDLRDHHNSQSPMTQSLMVWGLVWEQHKPPCIQNCSSVPWTRAGILGDATSSTPSFAKVAGVLSLGTPHSQCQMLFFSCGISLSDWFYHLFTSPWAIVGWTLFLLFLSILLGSSAWNLLLGADGSWLCKSLSFLSLPWEGVISGFFPLFFFNM